jgi:organic hydroperoxide reductase OsmC/OhrA
MEKNAAGELWVSKVTLHPDISYAGARPDAHQREHMHHKAHEACFIANSVKTEIVVEEKIAAGT